MCPSLVRPPGPTDMTTPELTFNTKSGRISCETIHTDLKPVTGPRVWDLSSQTPAPSLAFLSTHIRGHHTLVISCKTQHHRTLQKLKKQTITNLCIEIYPSSELRKKPKTLNKTHPKTLL